MRRREFIGLVGAAAAWPRAALAQQMGGAALPRVGVLWGLGENESSGDFSILMKAPQLLFFRERVRISASALARKIPTIPIRSEAVQAGLLMSYGPDYSEYLRKVASYVDKIIKGAKPADLPIEQPTSLILAINLRTAGAIGLTIPNSLLVAADEIFE